MILLDVNLLIYAVNQDAPLHRKAKSWIESALSGQETVAFSWMVLLAFLRVTTRPGLFRNPLPVETAFDVVADWLHQVSATIVHPGPRHLSVVRELLRPLGTGGNLTSDA
ncbi:MAG TPA: VapC toxin family PIN domain ribonuclease, partial [Solibacterales bacterium]|nr:VapC toxin family PIN domain ribonuclease [Bryobacterales bacterium]